ncbi:MAG: nitrilase-related carbon-nitrogen hydrolase [Planctomycetota bacterium JB042]
MTRIVRAALTETRNVADLAAPFDPEAIRRANVEHHVRLLQRAASLGARAVGFGELFPAPYFALERDERWRALAEDALDGPTTRAVAAAARAHGVVVVAPLYELEPSTGRRFNTAVVIDADGTVLGRSRKLHVPSGTNEIAGFHESFYYETAAGPLDPLLRNVSTHPLLPVFETAVGRVGVSICYDRHFPRVVETLARAGAEVVFSPAVTFGAKSRRLWSREFEVDAARHRIVLAGSNRRGVEPPFAVEYFGESGFFSPEGRREDVDDDPELVVSDLDLDALRAPDPSGWDFRRDARPDVDG